MSSHPQFPAAGDDGSSNGNEHPRSDAYDPSEVAPQPAQYSTTNFPDPIPQPVVAATAARQAPNRTQAQLQHLLHHHADDAVPALFPELFHSNDDDETLQSALRWYPGVLKRLEDAFLLVEASGVTDHLEQPQFPTSTLQGDAQRPARTPTPPCAPSKTATASAAQAASTQTRGGTKRGRDVADLETDDDEVESSIRKAGKKQKTTSTTQPERANYRKKRTPNRAPTNQQEKVKAPEKSTRRPAMVGVAPKARQTVNQNGHSVHYDKDGNEKRAKGTNKDWREMPAGIAFLEAHGAFANPGEPYTNRSGLVDHVLKTAPEIDWQNINEKDRKEWKRSACNNWTKRKDPTINAFFQSIDTSEFDEDDEYWFEHYRKAFYDHVNESNGYPDNFRPYGMLREFLTEEQCQERDAAFAEAQQLSDTITFDMAIKRHHRFPQLWVPETATNTPTTATSSATGTLTSSGNQTPAGTSAPASMHTPAPTTSDFAATSPTTQQVLNDNAPAAKTNGDLAAGLGNVMNFNDDFPGINANHELDPYNPDYNWDNYFQRLVASESTETHGEGGQEIV